MKEDDSQNGAPAGIPAGKKGTRASPQDFVEEKLEDLGRWQNNLIGSISGTKVEKDFLAHVNDDLARRYVRGRQLAANEEAGSKSASLSAADLKAIAVYRKLHNELPASMPYYNREALAKDIDRGIIAKAASVSGESQKTSKERPMADVPPTGSAISARRATAAAAHKSAGSAEPSGEGRTVMADKSAKIDGSRNKTQASAPARNQKEEKSSLAIERDTLSSTSSAARLAANSGQRSGEYKYSPGQPKENFSPQKEKPPIRFSGVQARSAETATVLPQLTEYLARRNATEAKPPARPLLPEIARDGHLRQSAESGELALPWRRSLNAFARAMGESDAFKVYHTVASKEVSQFQEGEGRLLEKGMPRRPAVVSFAEVVNKLAAILKDDCLVLKRDFKAAGDCQFFLSLRPYPAQLVQALKMNEAQQRDEAPSLLAKHGHEGAAGANRESGEQRELSAARKELSLLLPLIQLRCALWRADNGRARGDGAHSANAGQSARQGLAATIRQIKEKSERRDNEVPVVQCHDVKIYHLKNTDSPHQSGNARPQTPRVQLAGAGGGEGAGAGEGYGNSLAGKSEKKSETLRPAVLPGAGKRLITSGDFALLLVFALVSASRARVTSFQGEYICPTVCERLLFEQPSNQFQKLACRAQIAVQAQDNLEGLAQELFQDTVIGHLIADLNLASIEEEYWQGKRVIRLKRRQRLMLPVYDDIQHYFQANTLRLDKLRKQEIVTIIEDEQLDDEYVYAKLAGILGAGAGKEAPRSTQATEKKGQQLNTGSKEGWYADPANYRAAIFREDLISTLGQDGNHFQILDGSKIIQSKKRKENS